MDDDIIEKYKEAEMGKKTVWWHVQYKIITDLDTNGSDNIELKTEKIEVCESRINAEVGVCEINDEWTR